MCPKHTSWYMVLDPYFYLSPPTPKSLLCPLLVTTQIKSPDGIRPLLLPLATNTEVTAMPIAGDHTNQVTWIWWNITCQKLKAQPSPLQLQIDKKSPSSTIDLVRPVTKMLSSVDWTCDGFNKSLCQT